jgi:hypothetical protein
VLSGFLRHPLVPCGTFWRSRDRATTTCNLLDFSGTDGPCFIPEFFFDPAY